MHLKEEEISSHIIFYMEIIIKSLKFYVLIPCPLLAFIISRKLQSHFNSILFLAKFPSGFDLQIERVK